MALRSRTVLITGGATGTGLAMASRFLAAGSRVIVGGRRESVPRDAAAAHSGLVTRVCDLAREDDRTALVGHGPRRGRAPRRRRAARAFR